MSSSTEASTKAKNTTRAFARVLGPFFLIVAATVVIRASHMRELLAAFEASPIWAWVSGAFVLMGGIIIVALHPYWRGPAAVIVSLLGWAVLLRGILLMAFPDTFISIANQTIDAVAVWRLAFAAFAVVGLYLTYIGWIAAGSWQASHGATSVPDLPHAA